VISLSSSSLSPPPPPSSSSSSLSSSSAYESPPVASAAELYEPASRAFHSADAAFDLAYSLNNSLDESESHCSVEQTVDRDTPAADDVGTDAPAADYVGLVAPTTNTHWRVEHAGTSWHPMLISTQQLSSADVVAAVRTDPYRAWVKCSDGGNRYVAALQQTVCYDRCKYSGCSASRQRTHAGGNPLKWVRDHESRCHCVAWLLLFCFVLFFVSLWCLLLRFCEVTFAHCLGLPATF
jgi:hypothetical protein